MHEKLLAAAQKVLQKNLVISKDHYKTCRCKSCVDGPYLAHPHGCARHYTDELEINGVKMTCSCGLEDLEIAVNEILQEVPVNMLASNQ